MLEAPTADAYFEAPAGRFFRARRFLCSSPDGDLFALHAWGDLDVDDTRELIAVFNAAGRHKTMRRQLVVLRNVRSVSSNAMLLFAQQWDRNSPYFQTILTEAVVRPDGIVGMLSEGFYALVPKRYGGRVFTDLGDALAWLGADAEQLNPWLDAVDAEERGCQGSGEALGPLRATLIDGGADLSQSEAARALGLSTRSLQRLLADAGTTFAREKRRACIARAKGLLMSGRLGLKEIAGALGFRAPNRFSEAFRAETGMSPSKWRASMLGGEDGGGQGFPPPPGSGDDALP